MADASAPLNHFARQHTIADPLRRSAARASHKFASDQVLKRVVFVGACRGPDPNRHRSVIATKERAANRDERRLPAN